VSDVTIPAEANMGENHPDVMKSIRPWNEILIQTILFTGVRKDDGLLCGSKLEQLSIPPSTINVGIEVVELSNALRSRDAVTAGLKESDTFHANTLREKLSMIACIYTRLPPSNLI